MSTNKVNNYPQRHFSQLGKRINEQIVDYNKKSINKGRDLFQMTFVINFLLSEIESKSGIENLIGYDAKEVTFSFFLNMIHPEDFSFVYKGYKKAVKNVYGKNNFVDKLDVSFIATFRILNSKGDYIHVLSQFAVLEVVDGVIVRLSVVCIDISGLALRPYTSFRLKMGNNSGFSECNIVVNNTPKYIDELSKRELSVLRLVAEGRKSVEVAEILGISVKTVNTHRRNILRKTNKRNIIEVISKLKEFKII